MYAIADSYVADQPADLWQGKGRGAIRPGA